MKDATAGVSMPLCMTACGCLILIFAVNFEVDYMDGETKEQKAKKDSRKDRSMRLPDIRMPSIRSSKREI